MAVQQPPSPDSFLGWEVTARDGAPERVGHYRLLRVIAAGGMGAVFEAIQDQPRRTVAVKLMHDDLGEVGLARFSREAEMLARVRHPGVAQVFEAGTHQSPSGPVPFIAMEYIPGARSLTRYAEDAALDLRARVELMASVCDAAHAIHESGLVHRDLKPSNILVGADGLARIVDFGIARDVAAGGASSFRTVPGQMVGTPSYMSPEQCAVDPALVDRRSDVYSLAVVAYELFTGCLPYQVRGLDAKGAANVIRFKPPRPASRFNPDCSGDLQRILAKALSKDPARRYHTAADFATDLRRYLDRKPVKASGDSPLYHARVALARIVCCRRWTCLATAAILGILGVSVLLWAVSPFSRRINDAADALLMRAAPALSQASWDGIRVIAIREPFDTLGAAVGLTDFDPAAYGAARALHTSLLEKIARAVPRVVAIDSTMRRPSPHDAGLAASIDALADSGVATVVGVANWRLDDAGRPEMAPEILARTHPGWLSIEVTPTSRWLIHLAAQPVDSDVLPSFALATWAAAQWPGAAIDITIDSISGEVGVRPYRQVAGSPALRRWLAPRTYLRASRVERSGEHLRPVGLDPGSVIASLDVQIPPQETLETMVLDYGQVLRATDAELKQMLHGRSVIVIDLREGIDPVRSTADGRQVSVGFAHAAALAALQATSAIRTSSAAENWLARVALALAGGLIGMTMWKRPFAGMLIAPLGLLAVLAGAIVVIAWGKVLVSPLIPVLGGVVAACIAYLLVRHVPARPQRP